MDIHLGLKERAALLENKLNEMENIDCAKIEGAMYGFPRVTFSDNAIQVAAE